MRTLLYFSTDCDIVFILTFACIFAAALKFESNMFHSFPLFVRKFLTAQFDKQAAAQNHAIVCVTGNKQK
jgi:hypothetical protein